MILEIGIFQGMKKINNRQKKDVQVKKEYRFSKLNSIKKQIKPQKKSNQKYP